MANAFEESLTSTYAEAMTPDGFISWLTAREWDYRSSAAIDRLIRGAKNTIETELKKIERCQLLILDDAFLVPLDAKEHPILLEIIEDRHDRKSIVMASQLPVENWYDAIGDQADDNIPGYTSHFKDLLDGVVIFLSSTFIAAHIIIFFSSARLINM
ncbi:MAG: ATP-binding protein, partial [Prevotella sp.]|nr:ATP-binding protein [Prevotella sp.]